MSFIQRMLRDNQNRVNFGEMVKTLSGASDVKTNHSKQNVKRQQRESIKKPKKKIDINLE